MRLTRGLDRPRRTVATLAALLIAAPVAAQPAPPARPAPAVTPPASLTPAAPPAPAPPVTTPPPATSGATVTPPPAVFDDADEVEPETLSEYEFACVDAAFLAAHVADLTSCYGAASKEAWTKLATEANSYVASGCGDAGNAKGDAEAKALSDLAAATQAVTDKTVEQVRAEITFKHWNASQEAGATQKRIDAELQKNKADEELKAANLELNQKKAALDKVLAKVKADRRSALNAYHTAVLAAEESAISDDDFEALVQFESLTKDKTRRTACKALRQAERGKVSAHDPNAAAVEDRAMAAEKREFPVQQHAADTLRKSQGTASSTTTTNSLIENPGSPDKIAFSVLSALGADSKTTGTQTVLNLNLASLIWPDDKVRLSKPAWQRNLFLRGAFPLSATEKVPQTGAGAASAGAATEVSRFSLLLGGSFIDETDTRLPDAQDCYELVTVFIPFPQRVEQAAARSERRKQLYDVCAHIAAEKTRLAWRAGLGFFTPNGVDTPKTRPELGVGAIVWAPFSQLYLDFLYQGIVKPSRIDNMGAGFSFAGNVDGTRSGVNAALRFGLDYMFLLSYDHVDQSTDWEMRIAPTLRGKLFGDSIGTVALGPRILGSKLDSPGVLATIALTYDADTLVNSLMTPPTASAK